MKGPWRATDVGPVIQPGGTFSSRRFFRPGRVQLRQVVVELVERDPEDAAFRRCDSLHAFWWVRPRVDLARPSSSYQQMRLRGG